MIVPDNVEPDKTQLVDVRRFSIWFVYPLKVILDQRYPFPLIFSGCAANLRPRSKPTRNGLGPKQRTSSYCESGIQDTTDLYPRMRYSCPSRFCPSQPSGKTKPNAGENDLFMCLVIDPRDAERSAPICCTIPELDPRFENPKRRC